MKTPLNRVLGTLAAFAAFFLTVPLSAQVSYTYTAPPPPGYPAPGTTTKPPPTRATRQSAAAVQAPATSYPAYPGTYPPPAGYTYPPPPGYGTAPAPRTTSKPVTSTKSGSKSSASSKNTTAGPPPPPSSKVYGPTGDLSTQVAKLKESDKVQNLRLGELERDVSSIKRGGKSSGSRYDGGTDLAAHTTYVARPGDTLFRIASTHRVSVGEIQQLNRMTADEVHVGQTLLIPSPHRLSSPVTQASYKPATPGGSSTSVTTTTVPVYHTVKKGDSLKAIALKHKTTAAALASANKIKDVNKIVVGQRIKIPGRTTTVVSSKHSAPSTHESSDTVPLPGFGMADVVPPPPAAGLTPAPAPAPSVPAKPAVTNDSHRGILAYRVDRTDTIETIAQQFSTTPQHIREMNRLDAATPLKPGDEIMVPAMGAVSVSSR
jgi:LysM repeat protein